MKILIIRNYPSYMDVEFNTYNIQEVGLAKALIRKGHKCDIVFWTNKEECEKVIKFDEKYSLTIYYRRSKVILKNAIFNNIDSLIENYDIIQPCEYNQYQSWLLAKKYPQKTVIYHGPYYSSFNKKYNLMCKIFDFLFTKKYINLDTKFLVKSNLAKQFLLSKGIKNKNVTVVGVGIDESALVLNDDIDIPKFIKKIDEINKSFKLLYIGRWEERRNILFIIDLLKQLNERGCDVQLISVGTGDKKYVESCIEYAEDLGISSKIHKIEKIEQKYLSEIYKRSDIFLLPTKYEIFGMVLLEAMYYGLPVITTRNGGSDILIENNYNGIILDSDVELWINKILDIINNYYRYNDMGKNACESIHSNFTWNKVCKEMIEVYQSKVKSNENINGK